jgi:cytochrome P450
MDEILKKMTLDVLGSSIFDHEFNSLDGEKKKDLKAYTELIETLFSIKNFFKLMLTPSFFPIHTKLSENIDYMINLFKKLIEESRIKFKNGSKPKSMLDFMVYDQNNENGLSDNELISNWFSFIF